MSGVFLFDGQLRGANGTLVYRVVCRRAGRSFGFLLISRQQCLNGSLVLRMSNVQASCRAAPTTFFAGNQLEVKLNDGRQSIYFDTVFTFRILDPKIRQLQFIAL